MYGMLTRMLLHGALIFSFITVTAPFSESADWMQVADNNEGTFYMDRESLAKSTSNVKQARELLVFRNNREISRKTALAEYDCSGKKKKTIQTATFSNTGEISLRTDFNAPWEQIPPGTGSEALFDNICRQR